jgi:hypothetical protein
MSGNSESSFPQVINREATLIFYCLVFTVIIGFMAYKQGYWDGRKDEYDAKMDEEGI